MNRKRSLKNLIGNLPERTVTGDVQVEITDLTLDSRTVRPGMLFVAVAGTRTDGHDYIADALKRGAVACLVEKDVGPLPVPVVRVPDARRAGTEVARAFFGNPDERVRTIGITGTNGKTTTSHLLSAVLEEAGQPCSRIGTIEWETGEESRAAPTTTPDGITLCRCLARMAEAGRTHAIVEVSSHALDQGRVDGIRFAGGIFTNLTPDHLDYHQTMTAYRKAKARLFELLPADAPAALNLDDPVSGHFLKHLPGGPIGYGMSSPGTRVRAEEIRLRPTGAGFWLVIDGQARPVTLSLPGRHNVANALAAAALATGLGLSGETIVAGLERVGSVPGRLEPVQAGQDFSVFVDYAHTEDALENVLRAIREWTDGPITTVFGCGGDRDRTKRPRMGRVAARLSDRVIVTSDNPRTESPGRIIEEILAGIPERGACRVIPNRGRAIREAVSSARPGETILIAGKGHETYQIHGTERRPFDDRAVAGKALQERTTRRASA